MTYDFDKIIDRSGTGALKYEVLEERYGNANLHPMWVADMEWATPPFILDALRQRLQGDTVLGYTVEPSDYWPSVQDWYQSHHGYQVQREWLTYIPGVVKGIGFVLNVFTRPDEKVIIMPPVYHPFRLTTQGNERQVVLNPLRRLPDGYYEIDFDNLQQVCDDKCRVLLLSNPHNPAGLVWDTPTLQRLAHFACEHNLIVVSDEIHSDMAIFGHKHTVFTSVSPEAAQCGIVLGAPTKTFNMAGVVSSFAIVPNPDLREPFYSWLEANELNEPNMFAPIATIAAYRQGEPWRQQMLACLEDNIRYVEDYCAQHLPGIKPLRPQASFVVWLDCSGLGLDHDALNSLMVDKAHLALNDGEMFGEQGRGFMRINVGSPRSFITRGLEQLRKALQD